ncbi:MAG: hypothetical protein KDK37_01290 [Leptospiraceae bacterium]|nr:hypothetical protein [Leptospiraceae bacterium]
MNEDKTVDSLISLLVDRQLDFELRRCRNEKLQPELIAQYTAMLSGEASTLGDLIGDEEFQSLNWTLACIGLRSAGSDMIKKRFFVDVLEKKPNVFAFSLDRLISGERARQGIQATLELEKLRKELIRTAVYNPFFAQFLSEVLYNGIRGFLTDGGIGKDIPVAGNIMRAGQALLGKAMEGLQGNFEKPIKEFIRKNIDSTMHHTEKMLYSAFEGEEFAETAQQIYQDWAGRELGSMLELISAEEYAAAAEILADWPEFLATSPEMEALVRGASQAFYESRKGISLQSILEEHSIDRKELASLMGTVHFRLMRWQDQAGVLEKDLRKRISSFYKDESLREEIEGYLK